VAIRLVPELTRRGHAVEADALFARVNEPYRKQLGLYPKSGYLHNGLAWSAACCRRDLDVALEHSRTATTINPRSPSYFDTLAEVHFQRGQRDLALAACKRCLALAPENDYYRAQLRRIEAGDNKVPVPEQEE